jgi:acyl carrier protein phosphodiesterase
MNHVAHCFLSFDDPDLLIGNFIGDFIKGRDWQQYPEGVQRGILLHRAIDDFTDRHPASDRSVERVRSFARRYSAPVTDVLYDHLLIRAWEKYSQQDFDAFAEQSYQDLQRNAEWMPALLRERFPRMLAADFIRGYRSEAGMRLVMDRFSRRLPLQIDVPALMDHFFEQLPEFEADFDDFFPHLLAHARTHAGKQAE